MAKQDRREGIYACPGTHVQRDVEMQRESREVQMVADEDS